MFICFYMEIASNEHLSRGRVERYSRISYFELFSCSLVTHCFCTKKCGLLTVLSHCFWQIISVCASQRAVTLDSIYYLDVYFIYIFMLYIQKLLCQHRDHDVKLQSRQRLNPTPFISRQRKADVAFGGLQDV